MELSAIICGAAVLLFLAVWGAGIFPGALPIAAFFVSTAALAVVAAPAFGRAAARRPSQRPLLEGFYLALLLLMLLTVVPVPPWMERLQGAPRAVQHPLAREMLATAADLRLIDPEDASAWCAFSYNRAGTMRLILQAVAMFGVAFLSAVLAPARKSGYLRGLVFLGAAIGAAGYLSQWHFPEGYRLWWLFPVPPTLPGPVGCFINRNHFGGFLALLCPAALALTVDDSERKRWVPAAGSLVCFGVMSFALLASQSRGAFVAYAAALGSAVLLYARRYGAFKALAIGALVLAAIALLIGFAAPPVRERLATLLQASVTLSGQTRLSEWRDSLRLLPGYPLLGVGANALGMVYPQFRATAAGGQLKHAENEYVQILAEGGLIGGLLAGGLMVAAAWRFRQQQQAHPLPPAVVMGALGGLTVAAVHALFDFPMRLPLYAVMVATLAGLLFQPAVLRWRAAWPRWTAGRGAAASAVAPVVGLLAAALLAPAAADIARLDSHRFLKQAEARALARAIVWAPTSSHAWYYLGRESCRLSFTPASPRYRYGECCLSLAAAYNPHNYRMWYQLGYTRLTAGDLRGADEAFDRALALRPWLRKPEFPKPPEGRR